MSHATRTLPVAALAALTSCIYITPPSASGNNTSSATSTSTRSSGSSSESSTSGPGGHASDDEVRALVTEVLTPQLCSRLIGSYIGLPGDGGPSRGPAAGTAASAGRWWIRRCEARVHDGRIDLALGGAGWTWVDRESSGFRVQQYLLFEADTQLSADVAVGYDRERRIASLWMTPAQGVTAQITPRGVVTAEPTGIFSTIIGGVLPITGASASDRARTQAAELGSTQMRERLAAGFTMTFSLASRQVDFMVGALDRGQTPERPFPNDTTQPWLVNQRSTVQPGGIDVVGPIDVSAASQGLDIELEEGTGAQLSTVCAAPMERYLDVRLRTPSATAPTPPGTALATINQGAGLRRLTLPTATCPTLVVITPRAGATLPVRLRYRVAPLAALPALPPPPNGTAVASGSTNAPGTNGAVQTSGGVVIAAPTRLTRVRIQIMSVTLSPQNSAGHDWDVVGGEADPYVVTASVPLSRQIDRTPAVQDHNSTQWNRWLPGVYDATQDFPLRFSVFDEDTTRDEHIGNADLEAAGLPVATGELSLPVRTTATIPVQVGTLRLRIEAAQ